MKKNSKRPTNYDKGQHKLICDSIGVSPDPNAPGLTAYECVCVLLLKLNVCRSAINEALKSEELIKTGNQFTKLKQALRTVNRKNASFNIIPMY